MKAGLIWSVDFFFFCYRVRLMSYSELKKVNVVNCLFIYEDYNLFALKMIFLYLSFKSYRAKNIGAHRDQSCSKTLEQPWQRCTSNYENYLKVLNKNTVNC